VVEHQAVVEPLPFGRVEQIRLAFADPRGQAVDRLAAGQDIGDDRATGAWRRSPPAPA
jgi:hypothetical protein